MIIDILHSHALTIYRFFYQTPFVRSVVVKYLQQPSSGDHIGKVTPVPIPNTAVKLSEPMIVYTNVKVGIAGF